MIEYCKLIYSYNPFSEGHKTLLFFFISRHITTISVIEWYQSFLFISICWYYIFNFACSFPCILVTFAIN